jgi:hypothetical protein
MATPIGWDEPRGSHRAAEWVHLYRTHCVAALTVDDVATLRSRVQAAGKPRARHEAFVR